MTTGCLFILPCDVLPCRASLLFISAVHSSFADALPPSPPRARVSLSPPPVPTPQEQEFLQKQQQDLDGALKKIIQQHKLEISTIERDCLNHKQQLLRGRREISSDR